MTSARSMKIVLVRCKEVHTLDSSLKFTKHTLEGTVLLSLKEEYIQFNRLQS